MRELEDRVPHTSDGSSPAIIEGAVIDQLREAAEALNRGDPNPLAALFADNAEWRGIPRVPLETHTQLTRA